MVKKGVQHPRGLTSEKCRRNFPIPFFPTGANLLEPLPVSPSRGHSSPTPKPPWKACPLSVALQKVVNTTRLRVHPLPASSGDSYFEIALSTPLRGGQQPPGKGWREYFPRTGGCKRPQCAEGAFTIHLSGSVCPTQPEASTLRFEILLFGSAKASTLAPARPRTPYARASDSRRPNDVFVRLARPGGLEKLFRPGEHASTGFLST